MLTRKIARAAMALLALATLAWPVLLLVGCAHPEGKPVDQAIVTAVEHGWRAAGLPEPGERCYLRRARVYEAPTREVFAGRCSAWPEQAAGCLRTTSGREGWEPIAPALPLVVLRPGQPLYDQQGSIVGHELIHYAAMCTGIERDGDPMHADTRLWISGGVDTSVQWRMRAYLRALGPPFDGR